MDGSEIIYSKHSLIFKPYPLQQGRNLAAADNNLIAATAAYAKDRSALGQLLSNTLDRYGISIQAAATGAIGQAPVIPGLTAPTAPAPPKPITGTPPPVPPVVPPQ